MASPRSGPKNRVLLFISTPELELTIKGPPKNKVVEAFNLHQSKGDSPAKADLKYFPETAQVKVYSPVSGYLENYDDEGLYPCFFERTNYEVVIEKKESCYRDLSVDHPSHHIREAISSLGSGNILSGVINFNDEVGFSKFEVLGDGKLLLSFELQVFPSKLDYQKDFWLLFNEVNEEIYNLAFDFLMRTSFPAELRKDQAGSPAEFYSIINALFKRLQSALELIFQRPHHKIEPVNQVVAAHKARKCDGKTAAWLSSRPHLFETAGKGIQVGSQRYMPRRVMDRKKELTYDTYENRFIKWMLQKLERRLKHFQEKYKSSSWQTDDKVIKQVQTMRRYLDRSSRRGFFNHVGALNISQNTSLVMQMAPGYREAYKYYLMVTKGLNINSDLFNLFIKNTAQLYEYWCFLKINQLLRQKYRLKRNNLLAVDKDGITVNLKQGAESTVEFMDPRNNEQFTLVYNRTFVNLPTLTQKPDNVVELQKQGAEVSYLYIFDAKYRIEVDDDYVRTFGQPGPPEDTVNAMHRYRDALVSRSSGENDYRRRVLGACVLFPHNDAQTFAGEGELSSHKFFTSIDEVGIGALPFLPQQTYLVENILDEMIRESSQSAVERAVPQAGLEKVAYEEDWHKNVLIGPLGRKEQLWACLDKRMYYAPLSMVQSHLGLLKYVAIYQSRAKFTEEEGQGIYYYGKIETFQVKKRKQIAEVPPKRGEEEHLVVQFFVEEWKSKTPPVVPAGYGPRTPHFTSWDLFSEARLYPELHLNYEEVRLWRELRRIEDCISLLFPRKDIGKEDRFELVEFPGLVVKNEGGMKMRISVGRQEELINLLTLRKRPGRVLRDIINLWKNSLEAQHPAREGGR